MERRAEPYSTSKMPLENGSPRFDRQEIYARIQSTDRPGALIPAGRYVMPEDGAQHAMLVSEPFLQVDDKPEQWLDRNFLKIDKPTLVEVAGMTPETNWKLERAADAKEWKLADAKPGEQLIPPRRAR